MRRLLASLVLSIFLIASSPQSAPRVRIIVDGQVRDTAAGDLVPAHMLSAASIAYSPNDRILANGVSVPFDQPLQIQGALVLQLRRAVPVTVMGPNGQITISSAAFTVGEALKEAGISLGARDRVDPSATTILKGPTIVNFSPAHELTITTAGGTVHAFASASTVGAAAAEAGIPLMGLDRATPSENEAFPADGNVKIVRVTESTVSAYKAIPNETQLTVSADLPPPTQDVVQAGSVGLSFQQTRIRYEDGVEVSRSVESETVIRPPQTRIVRSSYWAAKQMFATSYSPCRSGVPGKCYNGTSSGLPVQRGVVAVNYDWYLALQGVRVFIPGYGKAVIGDVCGGCVGKPWLDLAFTDADYEEWSSWVTVYFLAPAPIQIPWFLQ